MSKLSHPRALQGSRRANSLPSIPTHCHELGRAPTDRVGMNRPARFADSRRSRRTTTATTLMARERRGYPVGKPCWSIHSNPIRGGSTKFMAMCGNGRKTVGTTTTLERLRMAWLGHPAGVVTVSSAAAPGLLSVAPPRRLPPLELRRQPGERRWVPSCENAYPLSRCVRPVGAVHAFAIIRGRRLPGREHGRSPPTGRGSARS